MNRFIFSIQTKDTVMAKLLRFVDRWPNNTMCQITVEKYVRTRSNQQNRYLWGVVYPTILEFGQLEGWTKDDLHDFFLIEHFGSEVIEGFGKRRHKPLKRSSKLSTTEFMDYIGFIQQFAAERGIYISDPDEEFQAVA